MTWTPAFNATFTRPLVEQLMAIVQRDQRAALDFVGGTLNGVGVLPSFQTYHFAPVALEQFPAILIAPMESVFDRDAVGSLQSENHIYVAVAVAHHDPQMLAELAQEYLAAVDAIFNTSQACNLASDMAAQLPLTIPSLGEITTSGLAAGTVKDLFVSSHAYDEIRRIKTRFACVATLTLIVDREET